MTKRLEKQPEMTKRDERGLRPQALFRFSARHRVAMAADLLVAQHLTSQESKYVL